MSKILELREKRAKAWEAAKAFLDAKRTQEGFVSAEDAATYDKMEADVVNLGKEIERLERQAISANVSWNCVPLIVPVSSKHSSLFTVARSCDCLLYTSFTGIISEASMLISNASSNSDTSVMIAKESRS